MKPSFSMIAKFILVRVGALFALILFLPLIIGVALLVRLTSKEVAHWSSLVNVL